MVGAAVSTRPIRVFISYAHANRDVVELLRDHLGGLENDARIEIFDDRQLVGGEEWDARLKEELARADLILFVVTAKFLRSSYCAKVELKEAIRRREDEGIIVMPIIAEHCLWPTLPLARLQALPKDDKLQLKPLNKWDRDTDVALTQIAAQVEINVGRLVATSRDGPATQSSATLATGPRGWRQPDPPDRCLGRVDDVATLLAALAADQPRPVVVYGGAGMGKSTLTREAAAHPEVLARYGDRRAWVELDKAPDPPAVAAALQEALGLPPGQEPWAVDAALRTAPALLLLDNLETPWDAHPTAIEDLLGRVSRIPGVALMVSLRGGAVPPRPAWGTRLEAYRLEPPHDGDLLRAIAADIPPDDPLLPDVLRALDGWPLAIELFAAQADGLAGLAATWRRWQAERTAMLDRGETIPGRLSSLAVSLAFSLDSPRMRLAPPHADAPGRLYAMLGRLPAGMLLDDADALLPGAGAAAAHVILRARLAHPDGGRIRMLAPVREHAARGNLAGADRDALHGHYLGLASEPRRYFNDDHADIDLPRLRAELVNLEALIARAINPASSTDPATSFQQELGNLSLAVGDARGELGQLAHANAQYQLAFNVFSTLTLCDPGNAGWQRDLSVSWNNLGGVREAQGDLAGALDAYTETHAILAKLAAADPGNAGWQRDLSISWERLASVHQAQSDRTAALDAWRQALAISERLAASFPGSVDMQTTQVVHLAGVARQLDHADPAARAEAAALLDQALNVLRPLAAAGRLDTRRQGWIGWIEQERSALDSRGAN